MTVVQENSLKKTPLYSRHQDLGAKIVNFSGWAMPVYYSGIIAEHQWTRQHCSIFDVSHLGEIRVKGSGAFLFLQKRLTNDLNTLKDGRILYNILCDEKGLAVDDILVYQAEKNNYYLIVNAASIETDYGEFLKYADPSVDIKNNSDETACVAVQGPKAESILEKIFGFKLKPLGYYSFKEEKFLNRSVWISRSGYTGEDGFEIFSSNETTLSVWDKLINAGEKEYILSAGLGSRNTLRLEAGNALYGNDLDRTTTPLEAGLGWAVSFTKGDFVGRGALLAQKEKGLSRKLAGFKMLDRSIAREHYPIFKDGRQIGIVTSGSFAPSVNANIGLGYVEAGLEKPGTEIEIEIHGRLEKAEIVKRPFVTLKHK